jgi:beta-lactamase class A
LPKGFKVAHKTGSITKHNHDAALVFPPNRKPFVLVVLTRGIEDEKASHQLIADITRIAYAALAR